MRKYQNQFGKLLICLLVTFFSLFPVFAEDDINLLSESAVMLQLNENKVVYQKNQAKRMAPASLTKIMTSLVALEHIDDLETQITISAPMLAGLKDANASVAGFRISEKLTYRDLLYGVLFPSGADATQALAIELTGSTKAFVNLMNQKAKEIGMTQTHFMNETGLPDDNHYSTAEDMAKLLKYALKNKDFYDIITTRKYQTTDKALTWIPSYLKTANAYQISNIDYILGGKTGFTNEAGYCLASFAKKDNISYLLVTLNAPVSGSRAGALLDAKKTYEYFFDHYGYLQFVKKGEPLITLKTKKYANVKEVTIKSDKDKKVYIESSVSKDNIKWVYKGKDTIDYNMKKGDKLGTITFQKNGIELDKMDVILNQNVTFDMMIFLKLNFVWILGAILILLFLFYRTRKRKRKRHTKIRK